MFEEIKFAGKVLLDLGLNDSHSGNLSILEDGKIFITSIKAMPGYLKEEDLIEVPLEGESDLDKVASGDLETHRAIYKTTGCKAIIHAHSPSVLALSLTENKILPQDVKGQFFFPQGISILKIRPGAEKDETARMIAQMMQKSPNAVVVKGIGSYVCASGINEALEMTSSLEVSSKAWMYSKLLAPKPVQTIHQQPFEHRKRTAIPPSIGVMGRRTGGYGNTNTRRDIKR